MEDHPDKAAQHSEIYHDAVQKQKTQETRPEPLLIDRPDPAMMIPQPPMPVAAEGGPSEEAQFYSVPRMDNSMMYRGHY